MFDLDEAIKEQCEMTTAKAIMEKVNNNDFLCDSIVCIASMLSDSDKKWLIENIKDMVN